MRSNGSTPNRCQSDMDALIGSSGYVGSTLKRQTRFDDQFSSRDIHLIEGRSYDLLVCAGAPGAKWIANRDPDADRSNIKRLAAHLAAVDVRDMVLISTVDVFASPRDVDETSPTGSDGVTAYGANRLWLESFVRSRWPDALIVRLPGLVGPGLRKNALFDLKHRTGIAALDARAIFQFYPMVNVSADIATARAAGLRLVHLTAEPLSLSEVATACFGRSLHDRIDVGPPTRYDFRTRHADLFGGPSPYTYSRRESLMAIRAYAQSDPTP